MHSFVCFLNPGFIFVFTVYNLVVLSRGAGLTWQACGKTLDQLVAKITEADPKDKKK